MTSIHPKLFPSEIWGGLCFQYDDLNTDKHPDFFWSDKASKEIIALEEYLLSPYVQDVLSFFNPLSDPNSFVSVRSDLSGLTYRTLVAGTNIAVSYPNETTCRIDALTGSADTTVDVVLDEACVKGNVIGLKTNGNGLKADSSTETKSRVLGLATTDENIGDTVTVCILGILTKSDWSAIIGTTYLTTRSIYYLASNGNLTSVAPTSGWLVPLGYAISNTEFLVSIGPRIQL